MWVGGQVGRCVNSKTVSMEEGLHNEGALCVALPCKGRAPGALPRSCTLARARASVRETVMSARPCCSTVRPAGHRRLPSAPV